MWPESSFTFRPVGFLRSCFPEKFGIPRQPGLVPVARATLELAPPWDRPEALQGLEEFSHVWLIFVFHEIPRQEGKVTVRPPRLGGNRRVGVFASRSMFRPNPVGLSVVELEAVELDATPPRLHLRGVDLLDGTPVLDIKPYLPYVDAIPTAHGAWADSPPEPALAVRFSAGAERQCRDAQARYPELRELIEQVLAQDPRPAYYGNATPRTRFGIRLLDFDVAREVEGDTAMVREIRPVAPPKPD
ncbi:MAG TPA: tRNA (N6-threonylcarbamoyladenosine(37)-N6)-methyltransferase TrmO [Chromatiales bacterium]|nr:tRNA (N6-threonylcarbamoyladenosine(37)-N6)-methyltransferase TrmO [Chromatiales bacterium]